MRITEFSDPRLTPARGDLAARSLAGLVEADRYADPVPMRVSATAAPMHAGPDDELPLVTEALFGETMDVYDCARGWAWGQLRRDGYVGWAEVARLSPLADPAPGHRVVAALTHLRARPDIRAPILMALSRESRLSLGAACGDWRPLTTPAGGWIPARHVGALDVPARDFVRVAETFLGAPYVWGGRRATGIDCSALVQLSMAAAGFEVHRDSDMQEQTIGVRLPTSAGRWASGLRRGDLVFWDGHVGIMTGPAQLLHANAHHMAVTVEPLAEVAGRIRQIVGDVTSIRRPAAAMAASP